MENINLYKLNNMGLDIKRNSKGQFNLNSTISDKSYHPEEKWISEDEAKKILITNELWRFLEKAVQIEMEFPMGYHVNDKICRDEKPSFYRWWLDTGCSGDDLAEKFQEMLKRLDLKIDFSDKE